MEARRICLIVASLALSGCAGVVSLHPLAVPNGKDTIFHPALLGTWESGDPEHGGTRSTYTVERAESGYKVILTTGKDRVDGTMHLLKFGDDYLIDVLCPSEGAPPPVHLFLRLRLEKDSAWAQRDEHLLAQRPHRSQRTAQT
jgi:hypothetical protein